MLTYNGSTCPHFGDCGGCRWQDVPYAEQLRRKEEALRVLFAEVGVEAGLILPILGSPVPFGYRNKMEFTAVPDPGDGLRIGLHRRGRFDEVVNIAECWLPQPLANHLLEFVRERARSHRLRAYDYQSHAGFLRNVVFRYAAPPEQWMVLLVTTTPSHPEECAFLEELATELPKAFPTVCTVGHVVNDTWSPISYGQLRILAGDGVLEQPIGGFRFRISPFAFFQVNWAQLERFFGRIVELAEPKAEDIAWDLYCGTGSIALFVARHVRYVCGVELIEAAVEDARANAALNGVENVSWLVADLHQAPARALLETLPEPSLILVDPPRAGIHWRLLQFLCEHPAERLVYVSCNPATQARDLRQLLKVYRLECLQPVDLFPQTPHVECIALLRRR
ncbi:MAG: 23S rRNA (uracil(1939)-C(5))-methyltransferase RlmD [Candidatus Kapabacteria bacterium]|nr:23S rRNA (uracil(1939)-C(5))-methyltransferase RlmD [Candidatus Kapabacteria bacterium]MDW8224987.1 23S rRNA (uracil(1939)-C(5))-methyltransferase RlmD [Bacteroidota bacterium]